VKLAIMLILYTLAAAASLALLAELLRWAFPGTRRAAPLILAAVLFLFPPVGALLPDGPACWFFQRWGNVFAGFLLYFFGALLVVWLLMLPARLAHSRRSRIPWAPTRAFSILLLAGLLILSVTVNVLGARTARDVQVTRYRIPREDLGQEEAMRIVLIADLHMGVNSTPKLYEDMAEEINRQEPDLVLVAGDVITSSYGAMGAPEAYAAALEKIRATEGVYVVYGNHDVDEPLLGGFTYVPAEKALRNPELPRFLEEECGWTILADETVTLPERGGLIVAGRRDLTRPGDGTAERASLEELLAGVDADAPVLLVQHEPAELERLGALGVDLALSGHTHDGQIFPGNLLIRLMSDQTRGMRQWGDAAVIVTSGVGYYGPPIRVGTVSEIVVIDVD
jgi:predicted MPP superfamily phosphohydrolase